MSNKKKLSYILGAKIDDISLEQALEKTREFLVSSIKYSANTADKQVSSIKYIVTPNPEICLQAKKNQRYQNILNNAFLSLPDGFGLKIGARVLGQRLQNRVTGVDFTLELMKLAAEKNWRVFLFGGEERIAQRCQKVLEEKYKGLEVVGTIEGRISNFKFQISNQCQISNDKVIQTINKSRADILLVALGAPLQEKWIAENLARLSTVKLAIGIGGTFDFIAGRVKRAPKLIRKLGLEWLWRLILEPWRWRRIYNAVLKFMVVVLKWRLRMRFYYRKNAVGFIVRGGSSVGRTSASQAEDRGFESRSPLQIFLVERRDEPGHWQLPQGGIEARETPEQAIKREMLEELGTDKFRIIKYAPQFYRYKWPKLDKIRHGFSGQVQDLFILQFIGTDADIKLDKKEHVNFKWVDINQAPETVHRCRKEQMEKAIKIYQKIYDK